MLQRTAALLRIQPPVVNNRGLLWASGATVPTDGTDGYQTGCVFQHTDGSAGTALYVNEGSVTSCAFKAVDAGGIDVSLDVGTFSSLTAGSGIALSSSDTSAVAIYGDDNGASIASSVYNLRTRLLLTVDQAGASIRALMAQLKCADGVDVETGIYTASQGYLELAGTHISKAGATLSCVDASLEIGTKLTVNSGGEACGIHVETTGTGTITNNGTCAAVLIDTASGAANWPYGVYVVGAKCHQAFVAGAQGTGVETTTTYPFAVEIHNEANADITAGDTGSSAGIYNRYEIAVAQTSQCNHISVFAKLRPKANMADGVHCGVYGLVEASETITLSGTATTLTCAAHFALDFGSGVTVSAGHVNGICVDSSINASANLTSATLAGIRLKKSGTCKAWTTGIVLEASACTTGISVGTCTTAIAVKDKITISPEAADAVLLDFELETEWTTGTLIRADFGSSTTYSNSVVGIALDLGTNIVATSEQSVKAVDINLPQMTMTAASPTLVGVEISAAGAFTLADSGAAVFTGVDVTTPAITQSAGTVTSTAFKATGGTLTSGSAYGLVVAGAFTTGVNISATCATGIAFTGTYTSNVIDFSNATINPSGSGGPCFIRMGAYGSEIDYGADNDQSGAIRIYTTCSGDISSYDRGVFVCTVTTGAKGAFPVAGLAEANNTGTGPKNLQAAQFIAHLGARSSGAHLAPCDNIAGGSTNGMYGAWLKVCAAGTAVCEANSRVAAAWIDNQMSGTISGEEYGIFASTGASRPNGFIGFETTSSGYDQLFYFDETFNSGAGTCVTTDAVPGGNQDARIKVYYNGTQYYIPLYR